MTFKPFVPPKRRTAAAGPRPMVLYVEDEDMNWELTERELRDRYDLRRARDSREAFAEMAATKFDVILMDIQLSGSDLDGIDIVKILRGKEAGDTVPPSYARDIRVDCPIVFVTAYGARYSKEDLLLAGGNDLATKPVNLTALSLVLARLSMRKLREA